MPEIRDGLDAILLGCFLFGLLTAVGMFAFGGDTDGDGGDGSGLLPFGLPALLVAVAWWGGIGYLLRRWLGWPEIAALLVAAGAGIAIGAAIQRLIRMFAATPGRLGPESSRLSGTLGHVASSIRQGGVGEVIYELGGVRQVIAARGSDGTEIARGTEVVVLRVDRGTAIVEPFAPLLEREREPVLRPGDDSGSAAKV